MPKSLRDPGSFVLSSSVLASVLRTNCRTKAPLSCWRINLGLNGTISEQRFNLIIDIMLLFFMGMP